MEDLKIDRISTANVVALQDISKRTFYEAFSSVNTQEDMEKYLKTELTIERLNDELLNELSHFYLAKLNGEIIGYLKLNTGAAQKEHPEANALEIERIYVLQAYVGKKIGQALYNKAIEVADKLKADFVWLGVWEHNARAIAFYQKNGFTKFGQHPFMLGNDLQTDVLMRKELRRKV